MCNNTEQRVLLPALRFKIYRKIKFVQFDPISFSAIFNLRLNSCVYRVATEESELEIH